MKTKTFDQEYYYVHQRGDRLVVTIWSMTTNIRANYSFGLDEREEADFFRRVNYPSATFRKLKKQEEIAA
jgi:hypothetical protein